MSKTRRANSRGARPRQQVRKRSALRTPVLNRHVGTCEFTGKRQYVERDHARQVRKHVPNKVHVYRCGYCGHYELGGEMGQTHAWHREVEARKLAALDDDAAAAA